MTTFYIYDHGGWYAGSTTQRLERSTELAPTNLTVAEVPGELRSNWTGYEWLELPFVVAPMPSLVVVPAAVTRRQAIQQLIVEGLDDDVQAVISAIPDLVQRKLMQAWYDESQVFERDRPEIMAVWTALGRTPAQLDRTFIDAAKRV